MCPATMLNLRMRSAAELIEMTGEQLNNVKNSSMIKVIHEMCCRESLTGSELHNNCSAECEEEKAGKRCSLTSGCGHA